VYCAGGWRGHNKYGILHMNEKETNQRLMNAGLSHSNFNEGLPSIVTFIIYINILVFGAWMWASKTRKWAHFMMDHWTVSALGIIEKHRAHTLFTSTFSHKSFFHLLVNCATLNCFCSKGEMFKNSESC
jgi:membrane associated rhomboid family serine protease